jgi:hypothetical protein
LKMSFPDSISELTQLLRQAPRDAVSISQALGISQPTFSRLWASVPDGLTLGAARARVYGLRRVLSGVDLPASVFAIDGEGRASLLGSLQALHGGFYALTFADSHDYVLYRGLPFFLQDARPQGFLGRLEPVRHRDLGLPDDILQWNDEHTLRYLTRRGEQVAGNILIGNESYGRLLGDAISDIQLGEVIDESTCVTAYPRLAESAMQGDTPGSSAGGEQPKFTATIARGERLEHVIVKFSPVTDSASGRRWADLLIAEHVALQTLHRNGIAAAHSRVLEAGGRVFLEVVRFDRTGQLAQLASGGRVAMSTFAAIDGDLGMADQNWTAVARELARLRQLSNIDQQTVERLDLFGALIGNTDRHHGNIAATWDVDALRKSRVTPLRYQLLPIYDMLPMLYRPNSHGEIIPRQWSMESLHRLELRHLPYCLTLAQEFWTCVLNDNRISPEFKAVAQAHSEAISRIRPAA